MAFQLSKRDENFYVLIHPDYPGFEVAANLSMFDNEEELKKGIVAQFCKDTSHEGYINLLENQDNLDYYDECWMDGKLCRIDWSQGSKEGQEIVLRMKDEFPDETIYDDDKPKNMISQYVSDRVDYPNEIFHYYNFNEPDATTKGRFGLNYDNWDVFGSIWKVDDPGAFANPSGLSGTLGMHPGSIKSWYAFKMDRVSKDVKCKIVVPRTEISVAVREELDASFPPEFTVEKSTFYALLHEEDRSVSPEIDMYFRTNAYVVNDWCKDVGLNFPYGEYGSAKAKELESKTHVWGLVYNKDTKKFKHIKGYARYFR